MKKSGIYQRYLPLVRDKDAAVGSFLEDMTNRTAAMFVWEGLPNTIPSSELERILQHDGAAFVTSVNGDLFAFTGGTGGEVDVYGNPTLFTISNPALNVFDNYRIGEEGVLVSNDPNKRGLLPLLGKYAVLYTDSLLSLDTAAVMARVTMLISASDDRTKASAEEFLRKIQQGDYTVIGENAFFKGVNLQAPPTGNATITQLIELVQYIRASMLNDLGLNSNYNMKRERLNLGEVGMNTDVLRPFVFSMLECRQEAAAAINEMYNTAIAVRLSPAWSTEVSENNTANEVERITSEL